MIETRWLASLSDGKMAIEGKGKFREIPNEPSPWQKLIKYLYANKVSITGLRIQVLKDGKIVNTYHLPTSSDKGRFHYLSSLKPQRFNYFRRYAEVMTAESVKEGVITVGSGKDVERHIEVHAIYEDFVLMIIVEEKEGNKSWVQIIPRKEYDK